MQFLNRQRVLSVSGGAVILGATILGDHILDVGRITLNRIVLASKEGLTSQPQLPECQTGTKIEGTIQNKLADRGQICLTPKERR